MRKQKGFSLIELLIVVAIILIIAAIAIPNLMRARMAANEASAVGSIRTINTGQVSYSAGYPDIGFAPLLANLGGAPATCTTGATSAAACLIDQVLASGSKSGYVFTAVGSKAGNATTNNVYVTNGDPSNRGGTGQRSFFSDESGVIRYNQTQAAASTDSPLQ